MLTRTKSLATLYHPTGCSMFDCGCFACRVFAPQSDVDIPWSASAPDSPRSFLAQTISYSTPGSPNVLSASRRRPGYNLAYPDCAVVKLIRSHLCGSPLPSKLPYTLPSIAKRSPNLGLFLSKRRVSSFENHEEPLLMLR